MKLQMLDLVFFYDKHFFDDDGFQNMFAYQPAFSVLQVKKGKDIDFVICRKSKGLFNSIFSLQHTAFLHSIKLFG